MAGPRRFAVVLAAAGAALAAGLGIWLSGRASLVTPPAGPGPADVAGSGLAGAVDQVTLVIDGMT